MKLNSTEAVGKISRGKYTFRIRPAFPTMASVDAVRAPAEKIQGRRPAMMKSAWLSVGILSTTLNAKV